MTGQINPPSGFFGDAKDIAGVGEGVKNTFEHTKGLLEDLGKGDFGKIPGDAFKVTRDVAGIVESASGLGVIPGFVPVPYVNKVAGLADSEILSGAQKLINAAKWTTGTGDPDDGKGFADSAKALDRAVNTLIDAHPVDDRWDGSASGEYGARNIDHRIATSAAQAADEKIGWILSDEAELINRTRESLDGWCEDLDAFDKATMWLNYVPGGKVAKAILDTATAAAYLTATQAKMAALVESSLMNSLRIREAAELYAKANGEKSGRDESGTCGNFVFVDQMKDIGLEGGRAPTRLDESKNKYTPPAPPDTPLYPPATPLPGPNTSPATPLPAPSKPPVAKG